MRRLLRPLCAILMVVLLQLLLVESGYACLATGAAAGDNTMAGMAMPAPGSGNSAPAEHGSPAPCRFPWAPNGCQTMAPCAPSVLAVGAMALPLPDVPHGTPVTREPLAHVSVSQPPELPPPRA
jgi:hypothetical protein